MKAVTGRLYMSDMEPIEASHPAEWLRGKVVVGFAIDPEDHPPIVIGEVWTLHHPDVNESTLPFGEGRERQDVALPATITIEGWDGGEATP